jgi:hypothetical protein
MPYVKFVFDKERDLFNLWKTCRAKSYGKDFSSNMPKKVLTYCRRKRYKRCRRFLAKYFAKIYSSTQIGIFTRASQQAWDLIEEEYFKRLKKITGKKLNIKVIYAYPTLASRCPYDLKNKSFMVGFFSNMPMVLATAGHEIMHLHFHEHYFDDVVKEVGETKAHDIKEALTVLLNVEFKDLWFVDDKGYEAHQKLREFILKEWEKSKDFDKLLKKCISFVKRSK